MNTHNVLIKPIQTEKSSQRQGEGQYTFWVKKEATKVDVKNAIKAYFGADVANVRISNLPKKIRQIGRSKVITKRPNIKKATVTLKAKQTIDPFKPKAPKKK